MTKNFISPYLNLDFSNCEFKKLQLLLKIIKQEPSFHIQLFSLESIEVFQSFLIKNKIKFLKHTKLDVNSLLLSHLNILIQPIDESIRLFEFQKYKIILFSNTRNSKFIPYKFQLTQDEKVKLVNNKHLLAQVNEAALSTYRTSQIDIFAKTALSLDYLESIIVMCLIRRCRFSDLCYYVYMVDNSYTNKTKIFLKINGLLKYKIIEKKGEFYHLSINRETVQLICEKIGFSKVLQ